MNDRIKELAIEAGFQYIKEEGIGWAGNYNASLPKFAELIVKDCYVALFPSLRDMVSRRQAYEMIEKHFGVGKQQINIGSRITVTIAGRNQGAKGIVNRIDPDGRLWVRLDGTASDATYVFEQEEVGLEQ